MSSFDIRNALAQMTGFGVGCLSIPEAADLVVIDMWYEGEIKNVVLDSVDMRYSEEQILTELTDERNKWIKILSKAASSGSLSTELAVRDFSDDIIPESTFVADEALFDWLVLRGYHPGDYWFDEYYSLRDDMFDHLLSEAVRVREARNPGMLRSILRGDNYHNTLDPMEEPPTHGALYDAWGKLVEENRRLTNRLEEIVSPAGTHDRPVPTRTKRTMLTIIAALCQKAGIDPKGRGAAARVAEAVQRLGATISDDTIKRFLDEIPEAIESRSK